MATSIKSIRTGSIDEYIAGFPKETQEILEEMRGTIRRQHLMLLRPSAMQFQLSLLKVTSFISLLIKIILGFIRHLPESEHLRKSYPFIKEQKGPSNFQLTGQFP